MSSQTKGKVLSALLQTPLGKLEIHACHQGLTAITFIEDAPDVPGLARRTVEETNPSVGVFKDACVLIQLDTSDPHISLHLSQASQQLSDYFLGQRRSFDLTLAATGTEFQHRAWQLLRQIPYGQTWSYGQQALALGNGNASRAVGAANAKNPLAIVVPCHRVIASNQQLTGYAGGLSRKLALLQLERSFDKAE